jgi:hypothetical protein
MNIFVEEKAQFLLVATIVGGTVAAATTTNFRLQYASNKQ